MTRKSGPHYPRIVTGLMLMAIGLAFFLDRTALISLDGWWRLWPVSLIVIGVGQLLAPRCESRGQGWGIVMILEGFLFLGVQFGWLGLTWKNSWPMLVMLVGLGFILDVIFSRGHSIPTESEEGKNHV